MPCVKSQVLEDVHENSMQFPSQNNRFLCNRPDGPLRASRRPVVSRSFSFADVQTTELHLPDAKSSYSEFDTKLDFRWHYLGRFCQTSGWCGNMSGHYLVFQNISGLHYKCRKEWHHWPSGRSSNRPDEVLFWEELRYSRKAVAEDHLDVAKWPFGRYSPKSEFEQY
jgi:hypothetical protein